MARKKWRHRRWKALDGLAICGQAITVLLCEPGHPNLRNGEDKLLGSYSYSNNTLSIDWSLGDDVLYDTLLHELDHGIYYVGGLTHGMFLKRGDKSLEEDVTRARTPIAMDAYKTAGLLRLPKIPKRPKWACLT